MEGILFIPPNRPHRSPELVCTECGKPFRPRQVADGAEELCDPCYEAQFQPLRGRRRRPERRSALHKSV